MASNEALEKMALDTTKSDLLTALRELRAIASSYEFGLVCSRLRQELEMKMNARESSGASDVMSLRSAIRHPLREVSVNLNRMNSSVYSAVPIRAARPPVHNDPTLLEAMESASNINSPLENSRQLLPSGSLRNSSNRLEASSRTARRSSGALKKCTTLLKWSVSLKGNDLLLQGRGRDGKQVKAGQIIKYNAPEIVTSTGVYAVLKGATFNNRVPGFVEQKCSKSFPRNWKSLAEAWQKDLKKNARKKKSPANSKNKSRGKRETSRHSSSENRRESPNNAASETSVDESTLTQNTSTPAVRPGKNEQPKTKPKATSKAAKKNERSQQDNRESDDITSSFDQSSPKPSTSLPKNVKRNKKDLKKENPKDKRGKARGKSETKSNTDGNASAQASSGQDAPVPNSVHTPPLVHMRNLLSSDASSQSSAGPSSSCASPSPQRANPVTQRMARDTQKAENAGPKKRKTAKKPPADDKLPEVQKLCQYLTNSRPVKTPTLVKKMFRRDDRDDSDTTDDSDD
ncbi:Hypothetical protein NTJ_04420 [Nesidiocoris tenuis]|uniref:SANTA domain-containing protein n=1 Tax=Nesidiocoris tenuis TaxID=355587 RepID=A0ABN7AMN9_9HEMI|nr:Hypothetical protein NTJ_04420 [Nesidiocoris tenuis]